MRTTNSQNEIEGCPCSPKVGITMQTNSHIFLTKSGLGKPISHFSCKIWARLANSTFNQPKTGCDNLSYVRILCKNCRLILLVYLMTHESFYINKILKKICTNVINDNLILIFHIFIFIALHELTIQLE